MEHLPFFATPVTYLSRLSEQWGVQLYCKRDDLFGPYCGGSKARMLHYILSGATPENCDVLLTAGGPCSNFNRVCALMCNQLGIPMHLVEYTDHPEEFETSLSYYLCRLSGVRTTRCRKCEVPEAIEKVIGSYRRGNKKLKYVYGGGRSLSGLYAYYDAVRELRSQVVGGIDHVFVACGTGTTLAGISAGMQDFFPGTQVHGISVARDRTAEWSVLEDDMQILGRYVGKSYDLENTEFRDDFLCGGYGQYNKKLLDAIGQALRSEGLITDPTYSGKALYGMSEMIASEPKYKGGRILFWNTGGIFNLLSQKEAFLI